MIPIATDTSIRRTPWVNYGLVAVNVAIFIIDKYMGGTDAARNVLGRLIDHGMLTGDEPRMFQFITYQFLHGNWMHVAGNMLFLYVFGNPVNAKMGHGPYLLFYLAAGVFAGTGFAWGNANPLVGASGSIAGITTAYLALFPRSHVTVLYWWFIIGTFEIPSVLLIVFKIILWDNFIAPNMAQGAMSNVAHSAHLAGYLFGFLAVAGMLALRVLPRDQFDIVALWRRWLQRRGMQTAMANPDARARAQFGRVARPVSARDLKGPAISDPQQDRITELRQKITALLGQNLRDQAAEAFEQLLSIDPRQVLARNQQLDIANQLYTMNRVPQAAAAYERFLAHYPSAPEADEVKLLLGIVYTKNLQQYEVALAHLRQLMDRLSDEKRREQCRHWIKVASDALGRPAPEL